MSIQETRTFVCDRCSAEADGKREKLYYDQGVGRPEGWHKLTFGREYDLCNACAKDVERVLLRKGPDLKAVKSGGDRG